MDVHFADPVSSRYFSADQSYGECAVCLCQWKEPLEVIPCRHIFCKECIKDLSECPECCTGIGRLQEPNSALLELQKRAKGKCSACGWYGMYAEFLEGHETCTAGKCSGTVTKSCNKVDMPRVGSEYFLESGYGTNDEDEDNDEGCGAGIKKHEASRRYGRNSSSLVSNLPEGYSGPILPWEQAERWKEQISCTAGEYGLTEEEFTFLKQRWMDFASVHEHSNSPRLRWRDACRLLRYMNLPNHPSDVMNLFHMALQSPQEGSVPFHVVCLWVPMSRRNPEQWYGMDERSYTFLLKYVQIIDVEKTGLFNEDQCREIGGQMLSRDLTPLEWQSIRPLVVSRAEDFRSSMPLADPWTISRDQPVKLPLHDIILLYNKFFDPKKKSTTARVERDSQSEMLRQRITRMLSYYNPAALSSIESTLEELKGQEETLLMTLIEGYGPEPQ